MQDSRGAGFRYGATAETVLCSAYGRCWYNDAADPELGGICFHAHACIEKLLKAMIVKRGVHPPHTHDLPKLLAAQPQDTREDALVVGACAKLQSLYPSSRYPELPMPTLDEARIAFELAQLVRDRLLPLLTS